MVTLRENKVTDVIREGSMFLMCVEVSIVLFNSSALELDFPAYTRDFIHPQR
jgi:hypothetical protein